MIGKIQRLCDLSYHVGHLILLGIQVQASGQGLRFCDLSHTRVHLLGLDRSGLAWYPVVSGGGGGGEGAELQGQQQEGE